MSARVSPLPCPVCGGAPLYAVEPYGTVSAMDGPRVYRARWGCDKPTHGVRGGWTVGKPGQLRSCPSLLAEAAEDWNGILLAAQKDTPADD